MFDRIVCALLSFCVRKFLAKSETQEPREITMECTSYVIMCLNIVLAVERKQDSATTAAHIKCIIELLKGKKYLQS